MSVLLLLLVLVATGLVLLSGVWVTIALIDAVWRVKRPRSSLSVERPETTDKDTP